MNLNAPDLWFYLIAKKRADGPCLSYCLRSIRFPDGYPGGEYSPYDNARSGLDIDRDGSHVVFVSRTDKVGRLPNQA